MAEEESLKSLLREALADLKVELVEEIKGELAIARTAASAEDPEVELPTIDRENTPVFDPNKPRAVWRKIRCAEPVSGAALLPVPGETQSTSIIGVDADDMICGRVYNKLLQYHDNPHSVDLVATTELCPKCGGTKWEELARFKQHGPKSPNVTILKSRKNA